VGDQSRLIYMKFIVGVFSVILGLTACKPEAPELLVKTTQGIAPPTAQGYLINHTYYSLSYVGTHRQSECAFYWLSPASIQGKQTRTDDFRIDPKVKSNPVSSTAYSGSGYDRGHLCPAADMALNVTAMSETFYMSNMSPMTPSFNRGIWSSLEEWVRDAAIANSGVYVATGPVLAVSCGTLAGGITVPCTFYKIAFKDGPNPKMIGFIMANAGSSLALKSFAVSIDEIERKTGIDFFPQLEDALESQLESKVNLSGWNL
jgi:endonuclease G